MKPHSGCLRLYHNQILKDAAFLKRREESSKIGRILDAGCGCGRASRTLIDRLEKTPEIIGIDLDTLSMKYGRSQGPNVHFMRSHMGYLPFRNQTFDMILSSKAIHEIENQQERSKTVDEFTRTLRRDGIIYVLDIFARYYIAKLIRRLLHTLSAKIEWYSRTGEFEKNLKGRGLTILRRECMPSRPYSLSLHCSYIATKKTRKAKHKNAR